MCKYSHTSSIVVGVSGVRAIDGARFAAAVALRCVDRSRRVGDVASDHGRDYNDDDCTLRTRRTPMRMTTARRRNRNRAFNIVVCVVVDVVSTRAQVERAALRRHG